MQIGMLTLIERMRWAAYGLLAGMFIGLFLGWMFHAFVGILVRLTIIAIILAPFVVALIFWMRVTNRNRDERAAIQDAEWRDINRRT